MPHIYLYVFLLLLARHLTSHMPMFTTVFSLSLSVSPPTPPATPDLECLFWGLYFNSTSVASSKKGLHLLTQKWSRTLRELDITNHAFSEEDLEIAIGNLAVSEGVETLRTLNLSGTKVTSQALRYGMTTDRSSLSFPAFFVVVPWTQLSGTK